MRKFTSALKIGVSLLIFLFLFRKANLSQSVQYLGDLRYSFLLLSIVLIVLGQFVRSHRLGIMVFGESARHELWQMMRVQMVSFLPGVVSPAKIGELTKVYMLQSESDVPIARGLACFVAERVLDVLLLGPVGLVGLYVFFKAGLRIRLQPRAEHLIILVALAIALGLVAGLLWARRRGISPVDLWRTVSPTRLVEAAALTVIFWSIVCLEVWCFCKAALFNGPAWHVALAVPPALLSAMIPITFSGFGLREAAMIILLQRPPVGTNYEQALLVSLMYDVIGLGVPALMGGFFWLMGKKDGGQQA